MVVKPKIKVSIRNRFAYKRHASAAAFILVTKYRGSFHPFAQQQMSIMGPEFARVNHTSDNATRVRAAGPPPRCRDERSPHPPTPSWGNPSGTPTTSLRPVPFVAGGSHPM